MSKLYTPRQAAQIYGVTIDTLRVWEQDGKIRCIRTAGNHRRFRIADDYEHHAVTVNRKTIIYARESSRKQAPSLANQILVLRAARPDAVLVSDYGSGLNDQRPGYCALLDRAFDGLVEEIVVTSRDRLCRFGFEFCEHVYAKLGVQITVLEDNEKTKQQEFVDDIMSIVTVFANKYHGSRRYKITKNEASPNADTSENDSDVDANVSAGIQPND